MCSGVYCGRWWIDSITALKDVQFSMVGELSSWWPPSVIDLGCAPQVGGADPCVLWYLLQQVVD